MNDAISSFTLFNHTDCEGTPPSPTPSPTLTRSRLYVDERNYLVLEFCGKNIDQNVYIGSKREGRDFGIHTKYVSFGSSEECAVDDDLADGEVLPERTYYSGVALSQSDVYDVCSSSRGLCDSITTSPAPGKILNVRYVDQVYVQQTSECFTRNGKRVCYWNHCGPASVAMILHYEGKESRNVLYNRQATLDLVCEVKKGCRGGSNVGRMLNALQRRGLQAHTDWNPTFSEIKQSIQNGHAAILFVANGAHFAVSVGYEDDGAITLNDPYGDVSWWSNKSIPRNTPAGSSPKLTGRGVEYASVSGLDLSGAIFITGSAPLRQSATTTIDASGATLISEGIQIEFPATSVGQLSASTHPITVTYTPLTSTTHSVGDFEANITSFQINATDVHSHSLSSFGIPYSITLDIDLSIIDNWDRVAGQVAEDGTFIPADEDQAGEVTAVLAGWSSNTQQWIVIPSRLDTSSSKITARSDEFTEFGVFVQRTYSIYLPVTLR
jgi:hypothetical protein